MSKEKIITVEIDERELEQFNAWKANAMRQRLSQMLINRLRTQRITSVNIQTILMSLPVKVLEDWLEAYNPVPPAPAMPRAVQAGLVAEQPRPWEANNNATI